MSRGNSQRIIGIASALGLLLAFSPTGAQAEQNEGSTPAIATVQSHLAVGGLHTCAVLADQHVQCWGNNEQGQLGNGTTTTSTVPRTVSNITTATAVAAGNNHSCALLADGTVQCWGLDGNGQVGDNSTYDNTQNSQLVLPLLRLKPVPVGNLTGATAIAAGGFHTCAIVTGATVKCWGDDGIGQLGDGKPGDKSLTATAVPGLTGVTALAMGEFHTCALLTAGTVKCWGHNGSGQLGDGTMTDRSTPVSVAGLPDPGGSTPNPVVALTAGYGHTCALLKDGTAMCWGENTFGQLGYATPVVDKRMTPSTVPQTVRHNLNSPPDPLNPAPDLVDEKGLTAISAGQFHTCAMRVTGGARCWGNNGRGQLGTDPDPLTEKLEDSTYTVDVAGLSGVSAVTAGGFHSCAIKGSGVVCWGYNFYGQLGSSASASAVPVVVTAVSGAKVVTAGTGFACALIDADTPGKPFCWGDNSKGQLGGDPLVNKATIRIPVTGIATASSIDAGNGHACALPLGSSTPQCWGFNETGQLGNGQTADSPTPVSVSGLTTAATVDAGGGLGSDERGHTCAVTNDGKVSCWGRNASGQLGNGTSTTGESTPVTVQYDSDPEPGDDHVTLADLTGMVAVSAGGLHTCGLASNGNVWCWGANASGEIGDGTTDERHYAVRVQNDDGDPDADDPLTGVVAIAAGGNYSCAKISSGFTFGKVKCWGGNGHGQLGDGSTAPHSFPATVSGLSGIFNNSATQASVITTGDDHACVVRKDGALVCWGNNEDGQIGNGSAGGNVTSPAIVVDMGPTDSDVPNSSRPVVRSVSASRRNTCAVLVDTAVRCWGDNTTNQLGDGIGPTSVAPVAVGLAGPV